MKYNYKISTLHTYSISDFNNYLKTIPQICLLTYGESSLTVDKIIKDTLIKSLLSDNDHYISSKGKTSTLNAICEYENNFNKVNYTSENCLICNGSTEGLFLVLSTILNEKDEVIVISPNYPLYNDLISYLGGKIITLYSNDDFSINFKVLKKLLNNKTKAIILNYPNNPTGKILSKAESEMFHQILKNQSCYIILDNTYQEISFSKSYSLLEYEDLFKRIIVINTLSKSHQLTGWRLGYILGDATLIKHCQALHHHINVCQSEFMLDAMETALKNSTNILHYRDNCKYVKKYLKKLNLDFFDSQGGFYLFFSIKKFHVSSFDFCKKLADTYQIGLLPGSLFYHEGFCRLSYSGDLKEIKYGLKRLKKALKERFYKNKKTEES